MPQYSNLALFVSEFMGTMLLILLGVGVSANTTLKKAFGFGPNWLLIAFGWGFAVFVGASVSWRSGAQLNPAVTLQQAFTGSMPWSKVPLYLVAQVLGAIVGAGLAYLVYKKQFDEADEPENTGGIFFTGPSILSPWWNIVSEAIGTFVLLIWIQESSPFQPGTADSAPQFGNSALGYAGVAFTVIAIGASLGGATGYAINPARDLGPRIMYTLLPIKGKGSSNWGYAWIPIVGPLVGVAAVVIFYNLTGAGAGSLP
ncbi:MAG: aquaporin family protein [Actinobacteria bacterium]|nr:MAG: aquaporin family protein [Actinomycetota bacterium]